MRYLVTGAAGFIGFHVAQRLLQRGDEVHVVDNLNEYYDVRLKHARLSQLESFDTYRFTKLDVDDERGMAQLFREAAPEVVVHLAAQAGVRYSLTHPHVYGRTNLMGFVNVLEGCRHAQVKHLLFASTSSVYGANTHMPWSVHHGVDHPLTLYAATKRANELMAHSYSHLFRIPTTALRFFTVYGPWGRPDMALFLFTKAILEGRPIDVFNEGRMRRDFTYIDDIVEGVVRAADQPATANPDWSSDEPDPATSSAPFRVYNIGNSAPVELMRYIEVIEQSLGKKASLNMMPMQAGDIAASWADIEDLERDVGYRPATSVETGVARFVEWYRSFYNA